MRIISLAESIDCRRQKNVVFLKAFDKVSHDKLLTSDKLRYRGANDYVDLKFSKW